MWFGTKLFFFFFFIGLLSSLFALPLPAQELNLTTEDEDIGGCMDCSPPKEAVIECAPFLPEGWWDVPEGMSPAVTMVIEENKNGWWHEGTIWYKSQIIVTAPTDRVPPQLDDEGELLIYFFDEYLPWQGVEEKMKRIFCGENPIS